MKRFAAAALLVAMLATQTPGRAAAHTAAEFAAITERGRYLAQYDQAAWHATDAVLLKAPKNDPNVRVFVARQTGSQWVVDFGKLNDDNTLFLTAYEATEAGDLQHFTVASFAEPRPEPGFLTAAAIGIAHAILAFGPIRRPYNIAVLPLPDATFYVYLYPAQTQKNIYPLGGDERFLLSADGKTIKERRRMHESILEIAPVVPDHATEVAGFHTAILADIPEDTDVFHVLARRPLEPEYVAAKGELYMIMTDGTIQDKGPVK